VRLTEQKRIILATLREREDHPSAEILYELVREKMPNISLGTVYRNLERFVQKGLAQRIVTDRERRYDPIVTPHFHFRCERCGSIEDVPVEIPLPDYDRGHPWFRDRRISGFAMEVYGLCPDCVRKRAGDAE